jgi:hypothetical protein
MKFGSSVRWLLLSTSVLTVSCDKNISVGENKGRGEQRDAGKNRSASGGGAVSSAPDGSAGGGSAAGASQTVAASGGAGGSTGTSSSGSGGTVSVPIADSSTAVESCSDGLPDAAIDLVSDEWTLQPGQELTECAQKTATTDLDITALSLESSKAISALLGVVPEADAGPDGRVSCNGLGNLVFSMEAPSPNDGDLFGVLALPAGTAIHVAAGQRLILTNHVVNTSAEPLTGVSRVHAVLAARGETLSPQPLPVWLRPFCGTFQALMSMPWSQQPGSEAYFCSRTSFMPSFDFDTIRVDTSPGTHDYELSVGPVTGPDLDSQCDESSPAQSRVLVTSRDGKSNTYPAPGGMAHVNAGEQLLLKVHVVNASSSPIDGRTTVSAR